LKVGTPIQQAFSIQPFVSSARFQYLGQDNVQVPTRGTELRTLYRYSTQTPNTSGGYSQWDTTISHFIPVGSRGIIFGTASGGTSFGAANLGLAGFSLGGPLRLSAYNRGELLGNNYFLAETGYLHRLLKLNPVIGDAIYGTGFFEIGKAWDGPPGMPNLPFDVSGAIVVTSFFGPVYGGVSGGDSGHFAWFFGLGRIF